MKYYEIILDGYILGVYIGKTGKTEITKEQYELIQEALSRAPKLEEGYGCRLRTDLVWEIFEIPEDESAEF